MFTKSGFALPLHSHLLAIFWGSNWKWINWIVGIGAELWLLTWDNFKVKWYRMHAENLHNVFILHTTLFWKVVWAVCECVCVCVCVHATQLLSFFLSPLLWSVGYRADLKVSLSRLLPLTSSCQACHWVDVKSSTPLLALNLDPQVSVALSSPKLWSPPWPPPGLSILLQLTS